MNFIMDLHTHSVACGHAYSTFFENVCAAYEKGLAVYGFSEHAPALLKGTEPAFFANLKILPGEYKGMRILKGCEVNIIDLEGHFDLNEKLLGSLDYVIASLHIDCLKPGTAKENTDCLIRVMDHSFVRIIAHPDDSQFPLEYERLVAAAKEKKVLLEVNESSLKPTSSRKGGREHVLTYLELCKCHRVPVILNTDAHYAPLIGDFTNGRRVLEEVDFPEELVVNTSVEMLRRYLPVVSAALHLFLFLLPVIQIKI